MNNSERRFSSENGHHFQALEMAWREISDDWKFLFITAKLGMVSLLLLLPTSCQRGAVAGDAAPTAKIEGEKLSLPEGSPQWKALSFEAAAEPKAVSVSISGRIVWDDDVTARIFSPVLGWISDVPEEIGRTVTVDDVLAVLKSPDYGQAQSDAKKSESDLALADRSLTRLRELFVHGAAAKKDLESAEADYQKAVAENQRAVSQLLALSRGNTNEIDGLFRLRSPVTGVVVEKNTSPGQFVRPDQMLANAPNFCMPLLVVSDPTRLWLWLDVSEMEMSKFKPGMALKIHSRAFPGKVFDGYVEMVGDSLDPNTRTVKVRGHVNNAEKLLKAEMFVTVDAPAEPVAAGTVAVSSRAVFLKSSRHFLFIEHSPGHFERREVNIGAENNGRILILDGIKIGQKVVSDGCLMLNALMESGN